MQHELMHKQDELSTAQATIKELKKEAQANQAKHDALAEEAANKALVKTLAANPGAFNTPPMSPDDQLSTEKKNGNFIHN